jgi:hypothetical protein
MKNRFTIKFIGLAIILMISASGSIFAQDSGDAGYNSEGRFGIRLGGIISKQTFDEGNLADDPQSKFGADVAILYTLPIGNGFFSLQPELHWMQKGSTFSDFNNNDITNTMNYLELPILLRFNFGGSLKLFAIGGPSAGYLLGVNSDNDTLEKDDFEDIEFGLHLGAGIGLGSFEIDVRYLAGLSDVANSDGNLGEIKNSGFGAGLAFKF